MAVGTMEKEENVAQRVVAFGFHSLVQLARSGGDDFHFHAGGLGVLLHHHVQELLGRGSVKDQFAVRQRAAGQRSQHADSQEKGQDFLHGTNPFH